MTIERPRFEPQPARRLALGTLAAALFFISGDAAAYCRTVACNDLTSGTQCVPSQAVDCEGLAISWPNNCTHFSVQTDASNQVSLEQTEVVMQQAFAAWASADCGEGTNPSLNFRYLGEVTCATVEFNQAAGNANIVVFRDEVWPHPNLANALALTTVSFNVDTGEIFDADLEFNSTPRVEFTDAATMEETVIDFRSVAIHEVGHFLGIAHSEDSDATMFADLFPGELEKRNLSPDDVAAICAIYPPTAGAAATCDPRGGLQDACGDQAADAGATFGESSGCAAAGSLPSGRIHPLWGLFGLGALVMQCRRRWR